LDVIAVSAVDMSKEITDYSNYGNSIDVAAPGGCDDIDSEVCLQNQAPVV